MSRDNNLSSDINYKAYEDSDYFQDRSFSQTQSKSGLKYKIMATTSDTALEIITKVLITLACLTSIMAPFWNQLSYFDYAGPYFTKTDATRASISVQFKGTCQFFRFLYCQDTTEDGSEFTCKKDLKYKTESIMNPTLVPGAGITGDLDAWQWFFFNLAYEEKGLDATQVKAEPQSATNTFVLLFAFISIILLLIATLFAWCPFKCCDCIKRLLFILIIVAGVLELIALITFLISSGKKRLCLNNMYTANFLAQGLERQIAWRLGGTMILIILTMVLSFISGFMAFKYLVNDDDNKKKKDDDDDQY